MTNKQVIGIDLGGTSIKLGKFSEEGKLLTSLTIPTPNPATPENVLNAMLEGINQVNINKEAIAIGIGTPGPVDGSGRIARVAINLSGWNNVPLADWLEEKTGLKTILANDANCAGLGEFWLGSGRNFRNLILITLGTGVGGAIILDGKLFVGHKGAAGELGLITVNPDGHPCNSGNQGSLEQHNSVQAVKRITGLEPEELFKKADLGDEYALKFWQNYGRDLGIGLTSLIYVLTPEAIIIGGGISPAFKFFAPSMWAEIEKRVLFSSREDLQIILAELGNQAGMVGAAKLALSVISNQ